MSKGVYIRKKAPWNKDKNHPKYNKWVEKIRKIMSFPKSEEHKRKISESKKGKYIGKKNPFYGKRHTKESCNKISKNHVDVSGKNNPNYGKKATEKCKEAVRRANKCPIRRQRISKNKIEFYRKYPHKHPNVIMAKKGFVSKPQMELYLLVKSKFPDAELEYPIKTKHSMRFADIGVPSLKLDIEYDGEFWHKNKQLDKLRDKQLLEVGWKTIRFNKGNVIINLNFKTPLSKELRWLKK